MFVGNLCGTVMKTDLEKHLSKCGKVEEASIIRDVNLKSKHCGIVRFETSEGAQRAIDTLHETIFRGRRLVVKPDQLASERTLRDVNTKRPTADSSRSVFVSNIHYDVSAESLWELMEMVGTVKRVKLFTEHNGQSKGRALVEFANSSDAANALDKLDRVEFNRRVIFLRVCNPF